MSLYEALRRDAAGRRVVYDDEGFHASYLSMRRRRAGINEVIEQPAVRRLCGAVTGLRVVDLGCGRGDFSRWLIGEGAAAVVGVDASRRMLDDAEALGAPDGIRFEHAFMEEVCLPPGSLDLVVSSLALHYVADVRDLLSRVAGWLRPGGRLVASMEHPIVSAPLVQEDENGWALRDYADEGERRRSWLGASVTKHHRTTATIVNAVLGAGLHLTALEEPAPTDGAVTQRPELGVHRRRPALLVIGACK
jgi:2-polyprenyl-3-methyl-5-hydroxy-6-metoxy-1,4-benzoquinol methylase